MKLLPLILVALLAPQAQGQLQAIWGDPLCSPGIEPELSFSTLWVSHFNDPGFPNNPVPDSTSTMEKYVKKPTLPGMPEEYEWSVVQGDMPIEFPPNPTSTGNLKINDVYNLYTSVPGNPMILYAIYRKRISTTGNPNDAVSPRIMILRTWKTGEGWVPVASYID